MQDIIGTFAKNKDKAVKIWEHKEKLFKKGKFIIVQLKRGYLIVSKKQWAYVATVR